MTVNPDQASERLDRQIQSYLNSGEISGGEILLLDREHMILHRCYGEQSIKTHAPTTEKTLYRMMSMTKLVTSLAALRLIERNELDLDAMVSDFLPSFANVRVADDPRYVLKKFSIFKLLLLLPLYSDEKVKTTSLQTPLTVKTLLNHTCGIEEGTVGLLSMQKNKKIYRSLEERAEDYAKGFLSFQPGTKSGYSPIGGMDVLGVILGKVTGKMPEQVLIDEVLTSLEMQDTGFTPSDPGRVIALTKYRKGKAPLDLTGSKRDLPFVTRETEGVCDCAGGLYGTVSDFGKIARMLLNNGIHNGEAYLKPETVLALRTPTAPEQHMKGQRWGLGFSVRENDSVCPDGCFGWSGAYGTHFLVDPENGLALVFGMNRTNIGGAQSYISRELEKRLYNKEWIKMKLPEQITFGELKSIPPFDRVKDALMVAPGPMGPMMDRVRLDRCPAGWSEKGIRFGLEKLAKALEKDQVLYPVYDEAERAAFPEKNAVNLLYFLPETDPTDKPFIVLCPGGSYLAVCAAAEGFPVAGRLAELGYPTFVLEYRVGMAPALPAALDDLAAAVRKILAEKEKFGLGDAYIVGGFSAGGHLAALWGTDSAGYRHYGLHKPEAILLCYPLIITDKADSPDAQAALSILFDKEDPKAGEYEILSQTEGFPPCYLVRCRDDKVLSGQHVLSLKAALDKQGIPCDLEEGEVGGHGFGDGRGTSAEGWVDRAHRFLQQLPERRKRITAPRDENERALSGFLDAVNLARMDLHAVCVRRNGKEVLSRHVWSQTPEQIESCTKSVVSLATGIAIGEGLLSLDDRLVDLFPEYAPKSAEDLWNEVQIRNLLSMTTGFAADPLAMNVRNRIREDWVGCCMRQPLKDKPGTRFQYHNASAHLIARAIQRRTGCTLRDWLIPRLFDPLDIPNPQWYVDPQGFTYGGDGLHLTVEQMARIGQLCLNDGAWEGRQLVPAWYVKEATVKQTENRGNGLTYHRDDTAGYGYFFWIADEPDVFYASGSGGKMIYCFKKQETVVAVTAHLEPFYQYQLLLDLVREHLLRPAGPADDE